jgi:hypothetical protein
MLAAALPCVAERIVSPCQADPLVLTPRIQARWAQGEPKLMAIRPIEAVYHQKRQVDLKNGP